MFLTSISSLAKENVPYILEVTKDSALFEEPSAKTQKIGDAEKGMNLLFIEQSRKGFWLKVKDSGGSVGWIPKNRTDFAEVETARSEIETLDRAPKQKR